jgi:hypothetical protein
MIRSSVADLYTLHVEASACSNAALHAVKVNVSGQTTDLIV